MDVTNEQALPILTKALHGSGSSPLAALKLSQQAMAFRQRVTWLRGFCTRHLEGRMSDTNAAQTSNNRSEEQSTRAGGGAEQGSMPDLARKLEAAAALPDMSDAALAADTYPWLEPHLRCLRSLAQVQNLDWHAIFRSDPNPRCKCKGLLDIWHRLIQIRGLPLQLDVLSITRVRHFSMASHKEALPPS